MVQSEQLGHSLDARSLFTQEHMNNTRQDLGEKGGKDRTGHSTSLCRQFRMRDLSNRQSKTYGIVYATDLLWILWIYATDYCGYFLTYT